MSGSGTWHSAASVVDEVIEETLRKKTRWVSDLVSSVDSVDRARGRGVPRGCEMADLVDEVMQSLEANPSVFYRLASRMAGPWGEMDARVAARAVGVDHRPDLGPLIRSRKTVPVRLGVWGRPVAVVFPRLTGWVTVLYPMDVSPRELWGNARRPPCEVFVEGEAVPKDEIIQRADGWLLENGWEFPLGD